KKNILMIVTGSIAAQKAPALARLLVDQGAHVQCVATQSAQEFVTLEELESASGNAVAFDLWKAGQTEDGASIEHIELTRQADMVLVVAATANFMARMVRGFGEDLAEATLLANNSKPVFIAPAMNVEMWNNAATQDNVETLKQRGVHFIGPDDGLMACGETGLGRMIEPEDITQTLIDFVQSQNALRGFKALVTSGPTHEPIDPVRFIGNRSSGKQGHAIAQALADAGADVTLITGPVSIDDPIGVKTIHVQTAEDMLNAAKNVKADIAVCAAAVSDWRAKETAANKIKKSGEVPTLELTENPDILATLSQSQNRPQIVVGFAAETENLLDNARVKIEKKGCDLILANDVSNGKIFGRDETHIHCITHDTHEDWGSLTKSAVAQKLLTRIIQELNTQTVKDAAE
ncbi:MAG: bifunctional phosphopantothenoylcysteine decarboxylase/phosphopantothenate--cysteine ligase CoaBC, partial [Pseudomonadota bacterium]